MGQQMTCNFPSYVNFIANIAISLTRLKIYLKEEKTWNSLVHQDKGQCAVMLSRQISHARGS